MFRFSFTGLAVALLLTTSRAALGAEGAPAEWIPQDALVTVEISDPKVLVDLAFHPGMVAKARSLPAYDQVMATPGVQQFLAVVHFIEASLGADWRTVLDESTGGGITLAACPDDVVLMIIDAKDAETLKRLHDLFLGFARSEAAKQGSVGLVRSADYRGVTGWTFDGKEAHAIVGNRLIWANQSKGLLKMLDLKAEGNAKSLHAVGAYQEAKKGAAAAAGPGRIGFAFMNLGIIKHVPPIAEALAGSDNPMAALLFAGVTETLRNSNWLALGLSAREGGLSLCATVDGKADNNSKAAAFAFPEKPAEGALPNLDVPGRIAAMSLWRDLRTFYAGKDDLFPERTSELIFFENMMGIFFSGRDLTEDVLAQTHPEVRVVVAEQAFGDDAPQLRLPSFAAVFRLRDPEKFALVAEEAWQKAIGLVNFTRGQQAQAGMIIRQPTHEKTTYTMAYFLPGEKGTPMETHHNFRPSLAVVGDFLVLGSTDALAEDLIDALKREQAGPPKTVPSIHSLVELDATKIASLLGANRGHLVRQNVVEKGHSEEQAATEIDLLLSIVGNLGRMRLSLQGPPQPTRAVLDWNLDLP